MDFIFNIWDFILTNNLIIVAVLWIIGQVIKKGTKFNNAVIIFILFLVSVCLMFLRVPVVTTTNFFDIITQSVFVSGAAIFVNESPKQFKKLFGVTISNSSTPYDK